MFWQQNALDLFIERPHGQGRVTTVRKQPTATLNEGLAHVGVVDLWPLSYVVGLPLALAGQWLALYAPGRPLHRVIHRVLGLRGT